MAERVCNADVLFIGRVTTNQVKFYGQFDHIVLLTAPTSLIAERLATGGTTVWQRSE